MILLPISLFIREEILRLEYLDVNNEKYDVLAVFKMTDVSDSNVISLH